MHGLLDYRSCGMHLHRLHRSGSAPGRAIGEGIYFPDIGIRNGINFHNFGTRNGTDFQDLGMKYEIGYNFKKLL